VIRGEGSDAGGELARRSEGTPWDARTYDRVSEPQLEWAGEVLQRLRGLSPDAAVLDVGCGTGRVTELLAELVPQGQVLAVDASSEMVELARRRLGGRARVWCQDVLDLQLEQELDAIVSTATLHWVPDHERLWPVLARALRGGGRLEAQCGGEGNIAHVREVIERVARALAPELVGFSPWHFAGADETRRRLLGAGFEQVHCWLEPRPTEPEDPRAFIRTSILAAHLERLPAELREPFADAVAAGVRLPLDYVRLNISARRAMLG
jgi:trans-aconitate 2-methyltransferase